MSDKLTKAEREKIIFDFLKGKPNPLYEVSETKYGKYIVKQKHIEVEEEEQHEEPEEEEEEHPQINIQPPQMKPPIDRNQARRERRKRNRRAKQDAKKILDALTNLINGNNQNDSSDEEDEDRPRAPPLVEQPQFQPPQQITFKRRRLAF